MGSMVIFHYVNNMSEEEIINTMMPSRIGNEDAIKAFFQAQMLAGKYMPAYVVQSNDINIAFDVGNGYGDDCVFTKIENRNIHTSTSVGDIIIVDGARRYVVMPMGFQEI